MSMTIFNNLILKSIFLITNGSINGFLFNYPTIITTTPLSSSSSPKNSIIRPMKKQVRNPSKFTFLSNNNVLEVKEQKSTNTSEAMQNYKKLKKQAKCLKLEAEFMSLELTLQKISNLEDKYDKLLNLIIEDKHSYLLKDKLMEIRDGLDVLVGTLKAPSLHMPVCDEEDDDIDDEVYMQINNNQTQTMNEYELETAAEGFLELPLPIQQIIAKSINYTNTDDINATEIIQLLNTQNRLSIDNTTSKPSGIITNLNADVQDDIYNQLFDEILYVEDEEFAEIDGYIRTIYPYCTRSNNVPLDEDLVHSLLNEVLFHKECNFKPTTVQPILIPGGIVIRGDFKSTNDNDENIKVLDEFIKDKLQTIILEDGTMAKFQLFYVKDPIPFTEERFENGEDFNQPALLVLGENITRNVDDRVSNVISIVGLCAILYSSIDNYYYPAVADLELTSLSMVISSSIQSYSTIGLLLLGICGVQVMHELGHYSIAWKDKFQIQKPILIPSILPQMSSIVGSITSLKTSPKNIKSFYDFAILGPILGLSTSIVLLVLGLQYTLENSNIYFPHVSTSLLKLSTLGDGIITNFLGDDYLLVDRYEDDTISLHPFALSGYIGILMNALNLLPIGNTDGGRISQALFGRGLSRLIQLLTITLLLFTNLFGYDSYNLFIYYVIVYVYLFQQNETDVPCRNEVDDMDAGRGLFAIFMGMIVVLCLVPVT